MCQRFLLFIHGAWVPDTELHLRYLNINGLNSSWYTWEGTLIWTLARSPLLLWCWLRLPVRQASCSGITSLLLGLIPSVLLLCMWETPTAKRATPPEPAGRWAVLENTTSLCADKQSLGAEGRRAAYGECLPGGSGTTDTHTTFQSLGTSQGAIGKCT